MNEAANTSPGSFFQMPLPEALHKALKAMNFDVPTPIQTQAIPIALAGHDLIGSAQTGTGKTAAFAIPVLTRLLSQPEARALVLVPTRELAEQVEQVFNALTAFCRDLRPALVIGGMSLHQQTKVLARNPRVIVATPGRLVDHLGRGSSALEKTAFLVLDEADRMLDLGFAPQLNQILRYLPPQRQTLLFSATVPPDILRLASRYLKNPRQVSVARRAEPAARVEQQVKQVTAEGKDEALLDEFNARKGSLLVFARTQSRTNRVVKYLESYGVKVERLHGGRTQAQRRRALESFRAGAVRVLVATDIAARGIDIDHVAHVINYDLPQDPEDYVHRIGRTGRAGRSGEALSLLTVADRQAWKAIQQLMSQGVAGKSPNAALKQVQPGRSRPFGGRPHKPGARAGKSAARTGKFGGGKFRSRV